VTVKNYHADRARKVSSRETFELGSEYSC